MAAHVYVGRMGDVVNLRRARKARGRVDAAVRAAERRARFGRTRAEIAADLAAQQGVDCVVDGAFLRAADRPVTDDDDTR